MCRLGVGETGCICTLVSLVEVVVAAEDHGNIYAESAFGQCGKSCLTDGLITKSWALIAASSFVDDLLQIRPSLLFGHMVLSLQFICKLVLLSLIETLSQLRVGKCGLVMAARRGGPKNFGVCTEFVLTRRAGADKRSRVSVN